MYAFLELLIYFLKIIYFQNICFFVSSKANILFQSSSFVSWSSLYIILSKILPSMTGSSYIGALD